MIGCCSLILGAWLVAASVDEIAPLAAAGNEASIQSITSYSCKVQCKMSVGGAGEGSSTAEYWRNHEGWRLREVTTPTSCVDLEEKGGKLRSIHSQTTERPNGGNPPGVVVKAAGGYTAITDPWQLGLFKLPVSVVRKPPLAAYSLAELVTKGEIRKAAWVKEKDRRLAHLLIALGGERRVYELWVDPAYNWMTTRCIQTIADEDGSEFWNITHEVTGMTEVQPSIFVPTGVQVVSRMKGKIVIESSIRFDEVRVNEPSLRSPPMPYPSTGGVAVDEIEGLVYPVDRLGRRSGKAVRLGEQITAYGPPDAEPVPDWRGIVGWSLAILAPILALAALVMRYRSRSRA